MLRVFETKNYLKISERVLCFQFFRCSIESTMESSKKKNMSGPPKSLLISGVIWKWNSQGKLRWKFSDHSKWKYINTYSLWKIVKKWRCINVYYSSWVKDILLHWLRQKQSCFFLSNGVKLGMSTRFCNENLMKW